LGWAKLNEYYTLIERSAVYIAAKVLIPSQKWTYFDAPLALEWIITAKGAAQDLWKYQYKAACDGTYNCTNVVVLVDCFNRLF
jgi:hypothetical protein